MMLADRQNRTTNRLEGERVAWAWGGAVERATHGEFY